MTLKLLIKTLLLLGVISLGLASAEAQTVKIPAALADGSMNALALETYRGQQVQMRQISSPRTRHLPSLLSNHQIELNNGDILYPQEIQYIILEARPPREFERPGIQKRMPREFE